VCVFVTSGMPSWSVVWVRWIGPGPSMCMQAPWQILEETLASGLTGMLLRYTHSAACAALCCAVLCCAVLCCAVLCCAVLCCAVLCCCTLCMEPLRTVHTYLYICVSVFVCVWVCMAVCLSLCLCVLGQLQQSWVACHPITAVSSFFKMHKQSTSAL